MRGSPLWYDRSAGETEWATDVMFRSPAAWAKLDPSLLRQAMTTFGSRDVMRFLGRTRLPTGEGIDSRFEGEVGNDLRQLPAYRQASSTKLQDLAV